MIIYFLYNLSSSTSCIFTDFNYFNFSKRSELVEFHLDIFDLDYLKKN